MAPSVVLLVVTALAVYAVNGNVVSDRSIQNKVSTTSFDDYVSRWRMMPLSGAAYSSDPQACLDNVFGPSTATITKVINVKCDETPEDTCQVFSGVNHMDKSIIISFRGSYGNQQILLEGVDSIFLKKMSWPTGGEVAHYFGNAFNMMWAEGLKDDLLALKNNYPDYKEIWFTGHSLGGALASLAAATIIHMGYASADNVVVYTQGEPRVGDHAYARGFDALLKYDYRVVHKHDPIPHVPFELKKLDYFHHKQEIWYDNDMSTAQYTVCPGDESDNCSNRYLDLAPADHAIYYGKHMNDFGKNGCIGLSPPPPRS
uniref:Lipase_3 domain-containing protein n=1 Tax=Rhabditophanes sp. KR3021 TaxID=114890 RepID=A0AC35TMK6_9BILA